MTGDIKYRPDAQVLVMTTEILRNLLYKKGSSTASIGLTAAISLDGLSCVVFDECHYINDRDRGKVWEETMILLDPKIQLVLLSATIDKPELFAGWLGDLKQVPIHLISTQYRIVPLTHSVFFNGVPEVIMDSKENFKEGAYQGWLQWRNHLVKGQREHRDKVAGRRAGGYEDPVVKSEGGLKSITHQLNEAITYFNDKGLLPCLTFVFSRAGCEKYASQVHANLVSSSDSAAITQIWNFHLRSHRDILEHLPQATSLLELVQKGVAYHHSGLLPILREMVEILFSKGLIKVLFATETFAVGINMPTKTVLFMDLMKFSDETNGLRPLRTDEYIQMAGRAGRRGKDTVGHVFYMPQREPLDAPTVRQMMTGSKSPITSRMDFGYDFILKTIHSGTVRWIDLLEKSYWYQQREVERISIKKQLEQEQSKLTSVGLTDELKNMCVRRQELEERVRTSVNSTKKKAQAELATLMKGFDEKAWTSWRSSSSSIQHVEILEDELRQYDSLGNIVVGPRIRLLDSWGFLQEGQLTELGILATEVNEGNQILMARAYKEGICSSLTQEELVVFLTAFLAEGKEGDTPVLSDLSVPSSVKEILVTIDSWAAQYQKEEDRALGAQRSGMWSLQTAWMEPCYRWVIGEDSKEAAAICVEYGLYEGNFMRSLLKLANLVEEWTSMATYAKDIRTLELVEGLQQKIVRGIVKPESLYLML
jgi:superfamily II RNA helicase